MSMIGQLFRVGKMKPAEFDYNRIELKYLDQTQLPSREVWNTLTPQSDPVYLLIAIKELQVRGAPFLGLIGAWGVCLIRAAFGFTATAKIHIQDLRNVRPTAVNLSWAVDLVAKADSLTDALEIAEMIEGENFERHDEMAYHSANLIQARELHNPLFICNAGVLATGATYGSSTGGWTRLHNRGYDIEAFVLETRPLNQGSRLTAWELEQSKISHSVTLDSFAATLMQQRKVDSVWAGADRVSADGYVANKVGTFNLAVLARHFDIPVFFVAPRTTVDPDLRVGAKDPFKAFDIEYRSPEEIAPWKVETFYRKVINPAFDVTPPYLYEKLITD